jgi:hypothetical protein
MAQRRERSHQGFLERTEQIEFFTRAVGENIGQNISTPEQTEDD